VYYASWFLAEAKESSSNLCVEPSSEAHPVLYPVSTGGLFLRENPAQGMTLTTHSQLVPRSIMSRSYTSPPYHLHGMYMTALLYLFLYRDKTVEAQVCTWVSPCGICGGQIGTGTGFSLSSLVFPCQCFSIMALHTVISPGGWTIGLLVASVQTHNLTPSTQTSTTTTCIMILEIWNLFHWHLSTESVAA
jgi:hypothetical protein